MHETTTKATPETLAKERQVAEFLEQAWDVTVVERDHYDPIDWDIHVPGAGKVAVVELKSYKRKAFDYPTVILNARKFIALRDASQDGTHAFYMVNFLDEVRYIDCMDVDISHPILGGQKNGPRSTDWEPVYMVPVSQMTLLAKKG